MLAGSALRVSLRPLGLPSGRQQLARTASAFAASSSSSSSAAAAAAANAAAATAAAMSPSPPNAATTTDPRALEPREVFGFFADLAAIPRPSRREQRVIAYLKEFADARRLEYKQDAKGNLVIYKPGQAGGEAAPPVILQGHVDIVAEKDPDLAHDFAEDPIRLVVDRSIGGGGGGGAGGWLRADRTTLGADNGIGVAAILAALDLPSSAPHPPLEALFTVEEEIGLLGASALDGGMLTGRTLVNLDSEDWGVVFIGCAGAGETSVWPTVAREPLPPALAAGGGGAVVARVLSVSGLSGGHSGLQIHAGLGNAVKLMAGGLQAVLRAAPGARVVGLRGGDKRNAIPREAEASLLLPRAELEAAEAAVAAQAAGLKEVYGAVEPTLAVVLTDGGSAAGGDADGGADGVLSRDGTMRLLQLLLALPHGPARMSSAMPGLVETSSNLASIKPAPSSSPEEARFEVIVSARSSIPSALAAERARAAAVAALAGAECEQPADYAGWAPNPESPVLALAKAAVAKACGGREPTVSAIHAGLECGVLGSVLGGGVDMVSYGPTVLGAHSPAERLEISTVGPFWEATVDLLARLAERRGAP